MAKERVKGEDGGATAAVNRALPRGKFKVTAEHGITVSGHEKVIEKGKTIELEGAAIQALMNEGSIEPA